MRYCIAVRLTNEIYKRIPHEVEKVRADVITKWDFDALLEHPFISL